MQAELKYQLRITLDAAIAEVARTDPQHSDLGQLPGVLERHNTQLKCQYDAFADYVAAAEREGVDEYPLYAWTKSTIEDAEKKARYLQSFTLYAGGEEVYEEAVADALEADLQPLVGGPVIRSMQRFDTNPANSPQPPKA